MRKRAQIKSISPIEPKHIIPQIKTEKKSEAVKKNWWIAVSLIGIFLLVLFLNSYFNVASEISINTEGKGLDKFYLSGPDPYYNMRLVDETLYGEKKGYYPYYSENDPLLNYPIGQSGVRPPLLNMFAIGFSRILTPFMNEIDAVGYSMQFVPALFGALLVFPVFFIGETLFGRKAGLVAAFLVALIPIHIGSGHGSAYSLFDHDSLNLLLFFFAFLFLIKGVKDRDPVKSVLYALLSGVSMGALSMTWVEGQFLYVITAVYAVVQMLVDIFMNKMEMKIPITALVALSSGYLISLPVRAASLGGFAPDIPLFLCIGIAVFGTAYYIFGRKRIPWTISLPTIFCVSVIALIFLYFINDISSTFPFLSRLTQLSNILYGSGIYGSKVAMTIAEAATSGISRTVMSFGPALYWLGWVGFLFLIYHYYKDKQRRDYLFVIILFLVDVWLTTTSGRFLNDMVPLIVILSGWIIWMVVDKIDYKQMIRNIRSAGGGLHGLRRGIKFLHIIGILFIAFLVILPNAYLALVASVPDSEMTKMFGENAPAGVFSLGHGKEAYWVDAYNWLNQQDTEIEKPAERPAYISWWDYGFYEVAVGGHPVVADNFQDGIPPASNFHTATSEKEAVGVWIVRLLEGDKSFHKGKLSEAVKLVLEKHLEENDSADVIKWVENTASSPSFNTPIGEKYDEELSKQYRVGQQYGANAIYHDITNVLNNTLDDERITWLYHDLQEVTGYSIRYYGVEGYDKQIFNIFGFLADKSLLLVAGSGSYNPEDDFEKIIFVGYYVNPADRSKVSDGEWSFDEINEMSEDEKSQIVVTSTRPEYKDAYFETMFYRTYIGPYGLDSYGNKQEPSYQLPCINMKHFYAEFISNYSKYAYYQGKSAAVIAKYYEGAYINGSVTFMGVPLSAQVVVQKNITHYGGLIPIDHDQSSTDSNGNFSLIAPAGVVTLQIRRNTELGTNAFVLKNVTFSSSNDSELAPISDDEAMRINGTNYERLINITIDPANIDGYVYLDKDNIDGYDISNDEPLSNVNVTLYEIQQFTNQGASIIKRARLTTDEKGYYNFSGLMPGFYQVRTELGNFVVNEDIFTLRPGNNSYNISKSKSAAVEGIAYYDTNGNKQYDVGEEKMSNVNVDIIYKKLDTDGTTTLDEILVDTTQTDEKGSYSFTSLTPGQYIINATKTNTTTGYLDYNTQVETALKENETTFFNISMKLASVTISGYTKYGNENIGNLSIEFLPDTTAKNNTAKYVSNTSDKNGYYAAELMPGYYNVSVDGTVNESGHNVTYTYMGSLTIRKGEGVTTFDIMLAKEE